MPTSPASCDSELAEDSLSWTTLGRGLVAGDSDRKREGVIVSSDDIDGDPFA